MYKNKSLKTVICQVVLCITFILILACNGQRKNEWITQHNEFNNHWASGTELGFILKDTWVDAAGNKWAISASGIILYRQKGGNWVREVLPVANKRFYCIAGRGNEVWVSGEEGVILYKRSGQPWVQQKQKAGLVDLSSMYVTENDLWIVGSGGVILHKTNTSEWEEEKCPVNNAILTNIKGIAGNLWIIGDSGVILHKSGNGNWLKASGVHPKGKLTDLLVQGNQVWITGDSGMLLHKTGTAQWISEDIPVKDVRLDNIFGWDNYLCTITNNGVILCKNGNDAWRIEKKHPSNGYFIGAWSQQHDIWLAGTHNVILHKHENNPWVREATPAVPEILTTISGNGKEVVAAGFNETILERNAEGKWTNTHEMITDAHLNGIYAVDDEAWVSDNKGNILYKNKNSNWQKEPSGLPTLKITGGYRFGDDIWLIGEPAVILHKRGNSPWKDQLPITGETKLNDIYGYQDEVWVAGTNNMLLYKKSGSQQWVNDYNGKNFIHFYSISRIGDDLYALGNSATILHKRANQQNWEKETINPQIIQDLQDGHFHKICKTDSGIYAAGGPGLILFKNNRGEWLREDITATGADLKDMAILDGTVWVTGNAGKRGIILHKKPGKDWVKQEVQNTNFLKIITYRGLCLVTETGFLYKENDTKNFLSKGVVNSLTTVVDAAACGGQLYFVGKNSITKAVPDERQYPTVTKMRYFTTSLFNPDSLEVQFTMQTPPKEKYKDMRLVRLSVLAQKYNDWQTSREIYRQVRGHSRLIDTANNSYTFAFRFEIASDFRITPANDMGNKLMVKVLVSSGTEGLTEEITLKDKNGDPFLTISNDVWHNNKEWLMIGLCLLVYYCLFFMLWFIKPLWFLRMYHFGFFKQLASLKPLARQLLIIVDILIPLRILAYKARVLDVWVRAHKDILTQQFQDNYTGNTQTAYIPLPLRLNDQLNGKIVDEPGAAFCANLLRPARTVVQIIGQGGAGKTMLAAALGCWMAQPYQNYKNRTVIRIPVLIGSDTNNLLQSLKEWFTISRNNTAITDDFLIALLKKQRLVVIIDSFSERSPETQAYFRNIHASLPVNALLITTRQEVPLLTNVNTRLYLQPLNTENLVYFITQLLEEKKDHPLRKYHDQIFVAKEIVRLINNHGINNGITPMLVKLIIDNALCKVTMSSSVDEIFTTIPDFIPKVYYDYLCNTHPRQETNQNRLSLQQLLTVAEDMAVLSIKDDFIPRDFKEGEILPGLLADPQYSDHNPVDSLIENGIISRRRSLGVFYLRFNLDTMAEYLGASRLYDKHRDNPHQLHVLIDKVNRLGDEAAGFKMAFEHVLVYKMKNG